MTLLPVSKPLVPTCSAGVALESPADVRQSWRCQWGSTPSPQPREALSIVGVEQGGLQAQGQPEGGITQPCNQKYSGWLVSMALTHDWVGSVPRWGSWPQPAWEQCTLRVCGLEDSEATRFQRAGAFLQGQSSQLGLGGEACKQGRKYCNQMGCSSHASTRCGNGPEAQAGGSCLATGCPGTGLPKSGSGGLTDTRPQTPQGAGGG